MYSAIIKTLPRNYRIMYAFYDSGIDPDVCAALIQRGTIPTPFISGELQMLASRSN